MAKPPPQSKVAAARAQLFKLTYANPIQGLTPARLISYLNAFGRGELRQSVLLWQQIIDRDDQVGPCADKRTRAVISLNYEILQVNDSTEAAKHKASLEHFYNNLTAYDGLNEMDRGGCRILFKQMMTAPGMRFAMHEIIWKPGAPGGLTADFKFLPLQFFENTTGRLRYLRSDYDQYGADLDEFFSPGGWMCTCGRGLMIASSIAYLFKVPAGLKALVSFIEKFAMPPLHGTTSAQKDSPEWNEVKAALTGYGEDLAILTDETTKITPLELKNSGEPPHIKLIERMDRAISRLWMGGDLATMSKDGGAVGSQPQGDDLDKIQADDAGMITDALQHYVDAEVIRMIYGEGVDPLAYFQLVVPKKKSTDESTKKIELAAKYKVPLSISYVRQELNLPEPKKGEELITPAAAEAAPFPFPSINEALNNPIFSGRSRKDIIEAKRAAFATLAARLEEIIGIEDESEQDAALVKWQADLPHAMRDNGITEEEINAWVNALGTAFISGAVEGRAKTKPMPAT